jgi:Asp/Glu/hydantoin racemase
MVLGPAIVTDETALAAAARQIETIGRSLARDGVDGILIAGFGDPGLQALRASFPRNRGSSTSIQTTRS